MIVLADISALMQTLVGEGVTFTFSRSGLSCDYDMLFTKGVRLSDRKSLELSFDSERGDVYRCIDELPDLIEFYNIADVLDYVKAYMGIT